VRHEEEVELLVQLLDEGFQAAPAMQAQARLETAPEVDGLVVALLDAPGQTPAFEGEFLLTLQVDASRIEGDVDRLPLGGNVPD
jgi:hypothetical protein